MALLKNTKDNLLMLLVLTLSFFILWNLTDLLARIEYQNNGRKMYRNECTLRIIFNEAEEMLNKDEDADVIAAYISEEFDSLLGFVRTIEDANISLSPAYFSLEGTRDGVSAEVILKQNEKLPCKMQEVYDEEAPVLAGESLAEYLRTDSSGTYIDIGEISLPVRGILKNIGINGQDERLLIRYDALSGSGQEAVMGSAFEYVNDIYRVKLTIGSESESRLQNCRNLLSEWVSEQDAVEIQLIPKKEFFGIQNAWYMLCQSVFGVISILFALLNTVIVFNLWLKKRRKELLIRKIWGYGNLRILALILRELCMLAVGAFLCSLLVWIVYLFLMGRSVLWDMVGFQLLAMLGGCLAVLVICMDIPYREITRITPAAGLSKYRR